MASPQADRREHPLWAFATRVVIVVAIAAFAYFIWQMRFSLLTAFAAVLLAVLLLALAGLLRRLVPIGHGWALGITVTLIVALVAGLALLVGTQVQAQFGELWRALPEATQALEQRLGIELADGTPAQPPGGATQRSTPGAAAVEQLLGAGDAATSPAVGGLHGAVLSRLTGWLTSYGLTIVDAILGFVLVVVAGVYLAVDPAHYHRGTVKLFPPAQHGLIDETMSDIGRTLRRWLLGKLISMSIIGTLAGLGSWLIGLPSPLALGIFAGVTEFIPIIGPIIGAVPALLLAATEGVSMVLWTLLLFFGIQQVESNLVAPLVQERMVDVPPALLVLGVGVFGALFGLLGLVLSGPLLVVAFVLVKKLWMRHALHESTPLPTDAPQ